MTYQFKTGDKIKFVDSPKIWTIDLILDGCAKLKEYPYNNVFSLSILILVRSASTFSLDALD